MFSWQKSIFGVLWQWPLYIVLEHKPLRDISQQLQRYVPDVFLAIVSLFLGVKWLMAHQIKAELMPEVPELTDCQYFGHGVTYVRKQFY